MEEIELGSLVCEKIKIIYYAESPWPTCHNDIVKKFGLFKNIMRKIYPDESIVEILKKVQKFDTFDIQDVFSMEDDYLKDNVVDNKTGLTKYADKVTWVPVPIDKVELLEKIRQMLK